MIEELFTSILKADIKKGNYVFQKNYLGSMCRVNNKTLFDLYLYLDSKGIKGGRSSINRINKGILPKKFNVRNEISNFLKMKQEDIFINIEKIEESKSSYLERVTRNKTT